VKYLRTILPLVLSVSSLPSPAKASDAEDLRAVVKEGIGDFHARRLERLETLELAKVLARKNPYLLKAKGLDNAQAIVTELLDDHLALQESTLFGAFLEKLAIHVCEKAFGGRKSGIEGIDLEFENGGTKYIVSIKSGPNWGNSSSIAKMEDHFRKAKKVLGSNAAAGAKVIAVNGCCYGRVATEDKGDHLKLCGQNFWALISGDDALYLKIIDLIGGELAKPSAVFAQGYERTLARFATEFAADYCDAGGAIRWQHLLEMNSGAKPRVGSK